MAIECSVIQFVGYKNSGKTTLMCSMAERLASRGFRVGAVKHDAHDFAMDRPGTDTWKLGLAGAAKVAITSPQQTAMLERRSVTIEELIGRMQDMDVVLVEGFKQAPYPKFVLVRSLDDIGLLDASSNVIAAVSWVPLQRGTLPVIGIGDTDNAWRLLLERIDGGSGQKEADRC